MSYTPGAVVASTETLATVVNTTAASSVFSLTIPGGPIVAAGDRLRVKAHGDSLNNSGSSVNYTMALLLGSTTVLSGGSVGIATASNRRWWSLDVEIAIAAVASQVVGGHLLFAPGSGNSWGNFTATGTLVGSGSATEDLTTSKTVALQVTMGTANALADFRVQAASVQLLRKPG